MVDPYDWLGVPKGPRPPNHYQLLGLDPVVADPAAIRAAADRQLRRLVEHLTGPDALAAEQVWTELEEARDTLLDADRRARYDATTPLAKTVPLNHPAAAAEPAAPDITTFEEVPAPATAVDPIPWWKEAPIAAPPTDPWWKQPPPEDPIGPPPAAGTNVQTSTVPLPAAPAARPAPGQPRPPRRQTSPVVIGLVGLVVTGAIAGGMYYFFGRKTEPATLPVQPVPDLARTDPTPHPPAPGNPPPPKAEEPVVAEIPLPKDFADQLRPRTFTGHTGPINAIAVAGSGSRFATAGADRTLRLWSVSKDAAVVRQTFGSPVIGIAWADNDRRLVAADGLTVGVFDPLRTNPPRAFESPRGGVTVLAVSPDGTKALTGLSDGYVRLWDLASGRPDEWPVAARGPVTAGAISPDGRRALAGVQDGPVSLWELNGRKRVLEWTPHAGGAIAVQFSPNGKLAATAGPDGTAAVYDLDANREVCRMTGHAGPVNAIAWQGARQIVTVGADGTARLWNAETGQPIRWVQALTGKGTCVAVDPGDRFVLAGTATGIVHLFPLPRVKGEALAGTVAKPPADPLPLPDPDAVDLALAKVRAELAKDYKYTRADDVSILADNLRRRAIIENVPPPLRYGLLHEARTLAIKAGDSATALRAVEDLAAWFDVDELAEKATTLAALPADADPVAVATIAIATAERAATDARPEIVDRVLRKLDAPADLPKNSADRLTALRQQSAAAARERQTVGRALDLLRNAPDDQGANQAVGLYFCLARQDWAAGLPYLTRGTDVRLIDAAKLDLSTPSDPKTQHRLGETWFAFAADARDQRNKRAYLCRARVWFERELKAKLDLAEEIKTRARLDDVAKLDVPGKDQATLPLLTPVVVRRAYNTAGPDVLATEWKLDGGAAGKADGVAFPQGEPSMRSNFGLAPGGKLTLHFRSDGRQVRIFLGGQEVPFAAAGKTFRVVIERKDNTVTVTGAGDEGEPVTRAVELPPAARGPTAIAVRVTGMPARPTGMILTSAIARGPASLPPPTPE